MFGKHNEHLKGSLALTDWDSFKQDLKQGHCHHGQNQFIQKYHKANDGWPGSSAYYRKVKQCNVTFPPPLFSTSGLNNTSSFYFSRALCIACLQLKLLQPRKAAKCLFNSQLYGSRLTNQTFHSQVIGVVTLSSHRAHVPTALLSEGLCLG